MTVLQRCRQTTSHQPITKLAGLFPAQHMIHLPVSGNPPRSVKAVSFLLQLQLLLFCSDVKILNEARDQLQSSTILKGRVSFYSETPSEPPAGFHLHDWADRWEQTAETASSDWFTALHVKNSTKHGVSYKYDAGGLKVCVYLFLNVQIISIIKVK